MNKKLAEEVKERIKEAREQNGKVERTLHFIAIVAYLEGMADEVLNKNK